MIDLGFREDLLNTYSEKSNIRHPPVFRMRCNRGR